MEIRKIYVNDILHLGGSVTHLKTIRKTPFSILAECSVVLGNIRVNGWMRTYKKGGGYLLDVTKCENGVELLEAVNMSFDADKNPEFMLRVFKRISLSVLYYILGAIFFFQSVPALTIPLRLVLGTVIPYSPLELFISGTCLVCGFLALYGQHAITNLS